MVRAMAVGMLVAGCVTPYQPQGFTGGYSDSRVAPGVFVVRIRGNGYTRSDTLVNYAVRRGRELCRGDGFPHAILADEADSANYSRTAGNYSSTTSVYGNTAYTQGSYSPGYVIEKHTITARAVCLTESEWERRSDDALDCGCPARRDARPAERA